MPIEATAEEYYQLESKLAESEERLEKAVYMLEKVITTKSNDLDYKLLCQQFIEQVKYPGFGLGYTLTEYIPEEQLKF